MEPLKIIEIQDPFNKSKKVVSTVEFVSQSLQVFREKYFPVDIDVVTSVNGKIIAEDYMDKIIPRQGDCILFTPVMYGGGGDDSGKQILGAVLTVALYYAAPYLGAGFAEVGAGGNFVGGMQAYSAGATLAYGASFYTAGVMIAGGILINSLTTPDLPGLKGLDGIDDMSNSATYGWTPKNTNEQGLVKPKFYGLNKIHGNIIAAYNETIDEKTYQNLLISAGQGPVKNIFDYRINQRPVSDYNGVEFHFRNGQLTQDIIPHFNDTKIEFPLSTLVSSASPVTYTVAGDSYDGLEIAITAPKGLWFANSKGGLDTYTVNVKVEMKLSGGSWEAITEDVTSKVEVLDNSYWSAGFWVVGQGDPGWKQVAHGGHDPNTYHPGQGYGPNPYDNGKRVMWRWITSSYKLITDVTVPYLIMSGAKTSSITSTIKADIETQGSYQIRVTKLTADTASNRYGEEIYLTMVRTVVEDDFIYPRTALVGVRALATDQLSGSIDISYMAECSYVNVYTGSQWDHKVSDNPAWVVWDILTQPVVIDASIGKLNINTTAGVGNDIVRYEAKNPSQLDIVKFEEWANFCDEIVSTNALSGTMSSSGAVVTGTGTSFLSDLVPGDYIKHSSKGTRKVVYIESDTILNIDYAFDSALSSDSLDLVEKRCTFNAGYDTQGNLWSAAQKVSQTARAALILNGTQYTVGIDKSISGDPTQPSQLFSAGNIHVDTFSELFLPAVDRAAEIEIDFINRDKNYTRDKLNIFNTNINTTSNKINVQLFGITSAKEAWRAGTFRLYQNQYIFRTISFDVDVDAIACTVGDCIDFAHEVPQWGFSGRIVSVTDNTITLDREITIGAGTDYQILIRTRDDTIITKTLTEMKSSPGNYSVLTLDTGQDLGFTLLNGNFTSWAGGDPVSWTVFEGGSNSVEEAPGGGACRIIYNTGVYVGLFQDTGESSRLRHIRVTFNVSSITGTLQFSDNAVYNAFITTTGLQTLDFTETSGSGIFWFYADTACDAVFTDVTIQEVIPYDIYTFGEINIASKTFRIIDMSRAQDLTRTITAVEYDENIYSVDTDTPIVPDIQYSALPDAMKNVKYLEAREELVKRPDGTIDNTIILTYQIEFKEWFSRADIHITESGLNAWRIIGTTGINSFTIPDVASLKKYDIAVVRVNKNGEKGELTSSATVSIYIYGKTAPPEDVANFYAQVSLNGVRLSWDAVSDIDLSYYEIRWTSDTSGAIWASALVMETTDSTTLNLLAAKSGTYLIKAVDTTGNESESAATVVTTVPSVINFNVQETLTEDPDFTGTKTNIVFNSNGIELDADTDFDSWSDIDAVTNWDRNGDIEAEGFYESEVVNLGSIQVSRLSASVEAIGIDYDESFDDIVDFDAIDNFDGDDVVGVGVEVQVNISQDGSTWDGWEKFTIGDYSALAYKFRARLFTGSPTRNIRITALEFVVNMPDREETGQLTTNAGAVDSIAYTKVFMSAPTPKFTIQNGQEGDSYILTNVATTGFDVEIKNSSVRVSRLLDWYAEKY